MSIFNEELISSMKSGKYICHECGNLMEFEDEKWREYESLYLTLEEVIESDK